MWCLMQTEKKKRSEACGKGPFSGWQVGARDECPSAWPRCRRSINHPSGATTRNPRKTFCRANDAALPFPFAVINDTVPRFPFSFSGGDKHGALYWHCGVLSSRQSVVGLFFCFLFFFLRGCRAETAQFSPPFLPLARQSVASAGGDAHVGGKWMIPLKTVREAQLPVKCQKKKKWSNMF